MIEKQILTEQMDSTIQRAMGFLNELYPTFKNGEMESEQAALFAYMCQNLAEVVAVYWDVEYNGNIEDYKNDIYDIARDRHGE